MPSSGHAETWAWKNNKWNKIDSTDQPPRSLSGAAYLPDKGLIFVYGGIGSNGYDDYYRTMVQPGHYLQLPLMRITISFMFLEVMAVTSVH